METKRSYQPDYNKPVVGLWFHARDPARNEAEDDGDACKTEAYDVRYKYTWLRAVIPMLVLEIQLGFCWYVCHRGQGLRDAIDGPWKLGIQESVCLFREQAVYHE